MEPIKQLDRAAAEVARQNYTISVEVRSEDEMGRLARTFNNMCESIRQAREDLIRQERISTIGRLSGSIVHDLRNPLAAIYGGSEMLVDADLPPAHVKRLAGNIYRASRRIQELLQDLLNVSRGKSLPSELCRLREVAAAACDSLAASAEAQRVHVTISIAPEIELPLERSRMERAFVNLIGNAIEAMPDGGEIVISAVPDRRLCCVQVAGQWPGNRSGDPVQTLPAFCERRQAQRSGSRPGADPPDGGGSWRRYVGGIGAGKGRALQLPPARRPCGAAAEASRFDPGDSVC